MKVLCASIYINLGEIEKNYETMLNTIVDAKKHNCTYVLFPQLALTGSTCKSLYDFKFFLDKQNEYFGKLIRNMPKDIKAITSIYNDGQNIPVCFSSSGVVVDDSINICMGIENLSDSKTNFLCFAHKWTIGSIDEFIYSIKDTKTYFASCGKGESSSSWVYSGICGYVDRGKGCFGQFENVYIDENTKLSVIQKPQVFPNNKLPFVPEDDKYLDEAIDILSMGLLRRLDHIGTRKIVIGVSGGLDSTLALLIAYHITKNKKDIVGITMPGFGTSDRTKSNAEMLMDKMGITAKNISIKKACKQHFLDIGHDENDFSITFENAQARERMQILFDYSNKIGALNVGTGDLSEAMLGFTTYGGDHLSMYSLNGNVPKTLVRALVKRFALIYKDLSDVLMDIVDTPISPELIPGTQKTESILGSYLYNDFAIYHTAVRKVSKTELNDLISSTFDKHDFNADLFYKRLFNAQFKRNCSADGVQVVMFCAAPGGDFAFPSDCKNVF